MKLNRQLSPRQKSVLQKAPEILLALFFLGILSTQFNSNEKIHDISSSNMNKHELGELSQENKQSEILEQENFTTKEVEEKVFEGEESLVETAVSDNASQTKASVNSSKAVVKTSSAANFAQMKMEVANYSGKISWASTFQRNVKSFVIERSIDDERYTEIGRVAGEGQGEFSEENIYEFEDKGLMFVQMPSVLYRIKQLGVNGDKDYSEVVEYDLGLPEGLYASVEVQDKNQLLIHYAATTSAPITYKILNPFGEPLSQGNLDGAYEAKSFLLEAEKWEKGAYYLQLESQKYSLTETFVLD